MSMEELRSFWQVLDVISIEMLDGHACFTIGQADNAVYFTREQFATVLCILMSLLVKQFLHVTWAPPVLVHPNVIWILMGCNVLNILYRLDILLVEICFIYTLKLGTRGRLSMSVHSPRLQFVTELPDFTKTEAKGVILVRGPWYETPGSLGLPFDVN